MTDVPLFTLADVDLAVEIVRATPIPKGMRVHRALRMHPDDITHLYVMIGQCFENDGLDAYGGVLIKPDRDAPRFPLKLNG